MGHQGLLFSHICFGLTGQPVTFFILVGSEPVRVLSFVSFPANNIRLLAGAYQLMYSPKETMQLGRRCPVWSLMKARTSPHGSASARKVVEILHELNTFSTRI